MNPELEKRIAGIVNDLVLRDVEKEEVFEKLTVNGITGDIALRMYLAALKRRIRLIRLRHLKRAAFGVPWLLAFLPFMRPVFTWEELDTLATLFSIPIVIGLWKVINNLLWTVFAPCKRGPCDDEA